MKAKYDVKKKTQDVIYIVDVGYKTGMSVTNDAEAVVADVYAKHGDLRIIYMDSQGHWDELVHDKGKFSHFVFLMNQDLVHEAATS